MSTITGADQILVLHAGKVAESGTHQELLAIKGRYYNMWRKQIRAERAAEQASQMVAKAKALKEAAMDRPGSSGADGSPSEDASENEGDNHSHLSQNSSDGDENPDFKPAAQSNVGQQGGVSKTKQADHD